MRSPPSIVYAISTQYPFVTDGADGGSGYALTAPALFPGNRQSGIKLGFADQLHPYCDDLFPNWLGKSQLQW